SCVIAGWHHTGVVLVPVSGEDILPRPLICLPEARAVTAEVPRVSSFHHTGCAACDNLVVVVVLPEIAARVDREFVSIPEIMRKHAHMRTVGVHAQREPSYPNLSVVAFHVPLIGLVVRRTPCVNTS